MKRNTIIMAIHVSLVFVIGGCASNGGISTETEAIIQEEMIWKETSSKETASEKTLSNENSFKETEDEQNVPLKSFEEFDIVSELERMEDEAAQLEVTLRSATSQADMTEVSSNIYQLWDDELNDLWRKLKEILSEEEFSSLIEEERDWIALKDAKVKASASAYEGGSIYSMVVTQEGAVLTRKRVYELADYLGAKTGQVYQNNDSGVYADCQGTESIYSDLSLTYLGVGIYDAEISLHRLGTLKGIARSDGDVLLFEDKELQIKGTIVIKDPGAVLTITESGWEQIAVGTKLEFPEKYESSGQFSFADISDLEFWFGSGAGAWNTVLYIHEDGTFEGEYLDCDAGSRIYYLCDFSGKFTEPEQVNAYTCSVKIAALHLGNEPETSEIKEGWTYHYSEPYGLDDADEILFYLPGAPIEELPLEFLNWAGTYSDGLNAQTLLPFYGLYNVNGEKGFSSHIK